MKSHRTSKMQSFIARTMLNNIHRQLAAARREAANRAASVWAATQPAENLEFRTQMYAQQMEVQLRGERLPGFLYMRLTKPIGGRPGAYRGYRKLI